MKYPILLDILDRFSALRNLRSPQTGKLIHQGRSTSICRTSLSWQELIEDGNQGCSRALYSLQWSSTAYDSWIPRFCCWCLLIHAAPLDCWILSESLENLGGGQALGPIYSSALRCRLPRETYFQSIQARLRSILLYLVKINLFNHPVPTGDE